MGWRILDWTTEHILPWFAIFSTLLLLVFLLIFFAVLIFHHEDKTISLDSAIWDCKQAQVMRVTRHRMIGKIISSYQVDEEVCVNYVKVR